jgi:hypothetical protein
MCSTVSFHSRFDPPLVVGQLLKFRLISIPSSQHSAKPTTQHLPVIALAQIPLHPFAQSLSPFHNALCTRDVLGGILNPFSLAWCHGRRLTPGGFSGSIDWVELKPTRKGAASFLDATFVIDGQGSRGRSGQWMAPSFGEAS